MKRKFYYIFSFLLLGGALLISLYRVSHESRERKKTLLFNEEETEKISKDLGHLLADTLRNYDSYYDFDTVVTTLTQIEQGKENPKPVVDVYATLMEASDKVLEEEAQQSLRIAEQFLADLSQKENIVELQRGKLYYEVLHEGEGISVGDHSSPRLNFTETTIDGRVIRDTREVNRPVKVKLSETLLGFRQGVVGMRVGERRKIYVHPYLAYGKLSLQQLVIFDVEIIDD